MLMTKSTVSFPLETKHTEIEYHIIQKSLDTTQKMSSCGAYQCTTWLEYNYKMAQRATPENWFSMQSLSFHGFPCNAKCQKVLYFEPDFNISLFGTSAENIFVFGEMSLI